MWSMACARPSPSDFLGLRPRRPLGLERDFVVHIAALAGPGHRWLPRRRRALRAEAVIGDVAATATATGIEHGQGRVEVLQHNLGGILLDAVLVVVFACLQLAFD